MSNQPLDFYLDRAKRLHNWHSDAQLAKALGISRATVSIWRKQRSFPGDEIVEKIALLGNQSANLAILDISAQRYQGTRLEDNFLMMRHLVARGQKRAA